MSTLYVVATPIGNLEDATPRSLRILATVRLVAAEDTRVALALLRAKGLTARVVSYNEHNRRRRIPSILEELAVGDAALVCDAGTPGVSDPGVELVAAARAAGHEVRSVPGPSALTAALSIAGLNLPRFKFVGFLPRTPAKLRGLLETLATGEEGMIAFEAANRLRRTLEIVAEALPARRLAVCRELTKVHEEVFSGTAGEALAYFDKPRGEIVLLLEGESGETKASEQPVFAAEDARLMRRAGLSRREATISLARRHSLSKKEAYALWLDALAETGGGHGAGEREFLS